MNKILYTFCFWSVFSESYAERIGGFVSDKAESDSMLKIPGNDGFIKKGFSKIFSFGSELLSQFDVRFSKSLMIDNMIRYYSYKLNPEKYTAEYVLKDVNLSNERKKTVITKLDEINNEKDIVAIHNLHDEIIKFSDDKLFQRKVSDYCNSKIMQSNPDISNVSEFTYFLRSIGYSFKKTVKSYCSDDINKGTFSKISDCGKEYTTPIVILPVNFIYKTFFEGNSSKSFYDKPIYKKITSIEEDIFKNKFYDEQKKNNKLKEKNNNLVKEIKEKDIENKKLKNNVKNIQTQLENVKKEKSELQNKLSESESIVKNLKTKQNSKDLKDYPKRNFDINNVNSKVFDVEVKVIEKSNTKCAVYKLKGVDDSMFRVYIDENGRIIPTYCILGKKIQDVIREGLYKDFVRNINLMDNNDDIDPLCQLINETRDRLESIKHILEVLLEMKDDERGGSEYLSLNTKNKIADIVSDFRKFMSYYDVLCNVNGEELDDIEVLCYAYSICILHCIGESVYEYLPIVSDQTYSNIDVVHNVIKKFDSL